jgi:hypothetical protein
VGDKPTTEYVEIVVELAERLLGLPLGRDPVSAAWNTDAFTNDELAAWPGCDLRTVSNNYG